jgi:2-polyprenyl-6-methoxyphenol hydroxylase-like FAD-dependent oxidoreductase
MYADSGREPIYSLPRDTLVSALYQHIQDTYPDLVVFHFGRQVEPVSFAYRDKLQRENQELEDDRSDMVLIKVVSAKMDHNGKPVDGMGCSPNAEYWTTDFLIGADGAADEAS